MSDFRSKSEDGWNDFQQSISQTFQELRVDLVDLTIFSGKKVDGHRLSLCMQWLVQGSHLEKSSRFHVQEGGERVPGQGAEVHGPGRGAGGEGALLAGEPRECNRQPQPSYEKAQSESYTVNNGR